METQIQSIAHLVVSLYAGVLFFEGVRRRRDIDRFSYVSIVNAGLASWNFLLFLYYGLDNPDTVYLVSQWGFVSVNSTIFGLFFFAWRISFGRKHDRLLPFFAVVLVVNCLLSITSNFQPLFLSGHRGFQFFPLRELTIIKGPWFIVHAVYSYLLLTLSLTLLVILYFRAIKEPGGEALVCRFRHDFFHFPVFDKLYQPEKRDSTLCVHWPPVLRQYFLLGDVSGRG